MVEYCVQTLLIHLDDTVRTSLARLLGSGVVVAPAASMGNREGSACAGGVCPAVSGALCALAGEGDPVAGTCGFDDSGQGEP